MPRGYKGINRRIKIGWAEQEGEYFMTIICNAESHGVLTIEGRIMSKRGSYIVAQGRTWAAWPVERMRAALMSPERIRRLWAIADEYNYSVPPPDILKELAGY